MAKDASHTFVCVGDEHICQHGTALFELLSKVASCHSRKDIQTNATLTSRRLIISFTNFGYLDMAQNLVSSLTAVGISNFIMFALDLASFVELQKLAITTFLIKPAPDSVYTSESSNFGSPEFNSICNVKPWITLECLKGGFDVIWTDNDIFWFQDCQLFFDDHPEADLQIQADDDDICAGFFYARSTPAVVNMLQLVTKYVNPWIDDQSALRRFLLDTELSHRLTDFPTDLCLSHNLETPNDISSRIKPGLLNFLVLPRALFPNGTAYFFVKLPQRLNVAPFIVHNNCIIGHNPKVLRFKMYNMWLVDQDNDHRFCSNRAVTSAASPTLRLETLGDVVTCLSINPNHQQLIVSSLNKVSKIYCLGDLDLALRSKIEHKAGTGMFCLNKRGGVWCMAWGQSQDDEGTLQQICFTGGHDRFIMVWKADGEMGHTLSTDSGTWTLLHTLKGHTGIINDVIFHNNTLFSASDDGTVRSWDITKGHKKRIYRGGGSSWFTSLAAHGPALFASCQDGNAYAWDIESGRLVQTYSGHKDWVRCICVDGSASKIYTAGSDGAIKEWSMIEGECLRTIHQAHSGVNALTLHQDNLYSAGDDGFIRCWNIQTWTCLQEYTAHRGIVTALALTSTHVVSGGADRSVCLWPLLTMVVDPADSCLRSYDF